MKLDYGFSAGGRRGARVAGRCAAACGERTPRTWRRKAWARSSCWRRRPSWPARSPPTRTAVPRLHPRGGGGHRARTGPLLAAKAVDPLLVESADGVWVVQADGSKRRLGDWREASWSPFGRFVVVAGRTSWPRLEPDGDVRWSLARPRVRFPRWTGDRIDTRIAYLSGTSLRVVAGDGTDDRLLRRNVAAVAPVWLLGDGFRLAYTDRAGRTVVVDADTGRILRGGAVPAPAATIRRRGAASEVLTEGRVVFRGTGEFRDAARTPDGRWLLVTWPTADQWVFVRLSGRRKIVAVSGITDQFGGGAFPRIAGWCCAP